MLLSNNGVVPDSPVALYYQIEGLIRSKILEDEWPAGYQLPSEKEICEMYGVSRITVRKALDNLQSEGYLERRRGKGTFVRQKTIEQKLSKFYVFRDELANKGIHESARMVEFLKIEAPKKIAARLGLAEGSPVFLIHRLRFMDETPYAIEMSYIPVYLFPTLNREMVESGSLYASLKALGHQPDSARSTYSAVNLSPEHASAMNLKPRDAAIRIRRATFHANTTVEYCDSYVRGDFFSYTVDLK